MGVNYKRTKSENGAVERTLAGAECCGGLPHGEEKFWKRGRKLQPQGVFICAREQVVGGSPQELVMDASVKPDRWRHSAAMGSPALVGIMRGCCQFEANSFHCSIGLGPMC
jgi:hypothetical protein